ncbi:hypothetical protein SAMN05216191_102161 [Paenibacillus jilunlii]|uniref:Uncharacterized protein n=1 Tax=Paenibacillus jilunlii TaxID=682956 RepID=A0A1G9IRF8_9BACL|nr:hypothetical protein SAMN05216191_102161 [Paenibacillus jilunlii]
MREYIQKRAQRSYAVSFSVSLELADNRPLLILLLQPPFLVIEKLLEFPLAYT